MSENKMTLNEMARRYLELSDKEDKWFDENEPGKMSTSNPIIIEMMTETDDFESLGFAMYGEKTFIKEVLRLMRDRESKVV